MLELNKLYNMDCMDGMKQFPDKYFELAVVDPPYGINASKMTMGSGKHLFKQGKEWDANIPDAAYFSELFRVSQNQIIWGGELLHKVFTAVETLACMGQTESELILRRGGTGLGTRWQTVENI